MHRYKCSRSLNKHSHLLSFLLPIYIFLTNFLLSNTTTTTTDNETTTTKPATINPSSQKLQSTTDYDYPIEDDDSTTTTTNKEEGAGQNLYSDEIKTLAQSKVFTVHFIDGSKKVFMRRKPSLGEVGEYEERKQNMFQFKGKPKEMSKVITDFYTYAASIHLRETKTATTNNPSSGLMSAEEVKNTVFEDFKRIIDACEYAMLFNPN